MIFISSSEFICILKLYIYNKSQSMINLHIFLVLTWVACGHFKPFHFHRHHTNQPMDASQHPYIRRPHTDRARGHLTHNPTFVVLT
ncbi:hypothetical protein HYC85_028837 [Camellia sinensis]|uniref:Uncharacterized protein n=1 Tax=Camellia sinensis TaxID=4442 RepID=A0A7J7G090_CAMSI|nr:hypothetical protein HYC85_028837 [Camellia sinensis]